MPKIKIDETKTVTTTVARHYGGQAFEVDFSITNDTAPSTITVRQKINERNFSGDRQYLTISLANIDELVELLEALRPQLGPAPEPRDPNVITVVKRK